MYSSAVELQAMPQHSRVNLCLGARRKGTIQVGPYFLMFAEDLKTVAIKLQVLLPMRGSKPCRKTCVFLARPSLRKIQILMFLYQPVCFRFWSESVLSLITN